MANRGSGIVEIDESSRRKFGSTRSAENTISDGVNDVALVNAENGTSIVPEPFKANISLARL
ncbi:hypothetical protein JIN85_13180 [Luteolibacter pohnpeiensis]|uniref:Uncharacterized protein n=2 Tax=Luteolibacter pohnpeiensis TaxID=454153 RepID=A0A934SCH5_9BACT|nr:hypothetical protein [Luteolibacter pohnpeiensis]